MHRFLSAGQLCMAAAADGRGEECPAAVSFGCLPQIGPLPVGAGGVTVMHALAGAAVILLALLLEALRMLRLAVLVALVIATPLLAAQEPPRDPARAMHIDPVNVGLKYGNPDGSCVQLSNGMVGCNNNIIQFSTLPFASDYGKPIRGGSGPSRVASYAASRGVPIWNVTGSTSIDWARWACKTGRFAAIGFFSGHFQTLYGYEPGHEKPWIILNNWYNKSTTRYSESEFRRLHYQSGPWIVVPKRATSPPPEIVRWWE